MRPIQCSFCDGVNPPNSKFCNACGAPLHLAPCPHCGAVNDAASTACHECAAELPGHATDALAAPAPAADASAAGAPTQTTGSRIGAVPANLAVGADELDRDSSMLAALAELRQLAASPDLVAVRAESSPAARVEARAMPVARADTAPVKPAAGLTRPTAFSVRDRMPRRGRSAVIVGALILAVVGAYGYYAYHQRSIESLARRSAATGEVKGAGSGVGAGNIVSPGPSPITKEKPVESTPAPAATTVVDVPRVAPTPDRSSPVSRQADAVPGDARTAGADPVAAASRAAGPQRRAGGEPRTPPEPPAPVARTGAGTGSDTEGRRLGPCTEGVAALGLCTPDSTQGRQ